MISVLASVLLTISCAVTGEPLPTEELIDNSNAPEIPADYQLIYDSPNPLSLLNRDQCDDSSAEKNEKTTENPIRLQQVRALIWLKRMDLSQSQIKRLMDLRQEVVDRQNKIIEAEKKAALVIYQTESKIYDNLWEGLSEGNELDSDYFEEHLTALAESRESNKRDNILQLRIEAIKGIFDLERKFLKELSRNQEQTMVEALFFLRHILDPIGSPRDFQALIGNTYEPGQYAVLGRGNSEIARQSMNIGGLWTDKSEKTGRALHEARLEAILYLLLLEEGLDEALKVALSLATR